MIIDTVGPIFLASSLLKVIERKTAPLDRNDEYVRGKKKQNGPQKTTILKEFSLQAARLHKYDFTLSLDTHWH